MITKTLVLPMPNRCLSPNARPNRFAKAAATKSHRTNARRETYALMKGLDLPDGFVILSIQYAPHWKTRSRKDDTNLIASCKAYEDGIQDATGQDDSTWEIEKPLHNFDKDNSRLEIHINIQPL